MKPLKLFVVGRAGAGKDEVAKYFVDNYGFQHLKFASGVYDIAREHFGMQGKDRKLLQIIGNVARIIDPDYWILQLIAKVQNINSNIIISDARFINEYKALIENGFTGLNLDVKDEIRFARLEKRDGTVQMETLSDVSETEMDQFRFKLFSITNNASLKHLHKTLRELLHLIGVKEVQK